MPSFASSPLGMVAAFLLTYTLHSTLLLGGAWLVSRRLAGRHAALEEWIWRGALVGGMLTAALQLSLPERPWINTAVTVSRPAADSRIETSAAPRSAQPVMKRALPSRTPWLR